MTMSLTRAIFIYNTNSLIKLRVMSMTMNMSMSLVKVMSLIKNKRL